jgi:hypothetical protein
MIDYVLKQEHQIKQQLKLNYLKLTHQHKQYKKHSLHY